jgi:hypothetical protein
MYCYPGYAARIVVGSSQAIKAGAGIVRGMQRMFREGRER